MTGEHAEVTQQVKAGRGDCRAEADQLLKPDDVPTYVEYGAAELGISARGLAWLKELLRVLGRPATDGGAWAWRYPSALQLSSAIGLGGHRRSI